MTARGNETPARTPEPRRTAADAAGADGSSPQIVDTEVPATLRAARELLDRGDLEGFAETVDGSWITLVTDFPDELHALLNDVPGEFIAARPRFAIGRDILFQFHDQSRVRSTLTLATRRERLLADGDGLVDLLALGLGQMLALRMTRDYDAAREIAVRDRDLTQQQLHAWLEITPELRGMVQLHWGLSRMLALDLTGAVQEFQESYWAGRRSASAYLARNAATNGALLLALMGDIAGAEEWLDKAAQLDAAPVALRRFVEDWGPLVEAAVALARLDVDAAREALGRFEPASDTGLSWSIEHFLRARLGLLEGEPIGALHALELARHPKGGPATPSSFDAVLLATAAVDLALAQGAAPRAAALLDRAGRSPELALARARLALLSGDAVGALGHALAGTTAGARLGRVDLALTAAVAALRLDRPDDAVGHAREAVELARTTQALLPFALAPRDDVVALLALVAHDARDTAPITEELRRVPEVFVRPVEVVELSDRERVVLRELTRTGSVQEIADALVVSVNTIKSQLRSVYRKLGVGAREDALGEAHRLGLDLGD